EVALGLANVFRPKVLQRHTRYAEVAADALSEKRLSGADGAAQEIPHGNGVECTTLQQRRIVAQACLRRFVADDRVDRPSGFDELEQAAALPFDQPLFQRPKRRRVQAAAALPRGLDQDV